jgi:3,5-epimerase/4-reductase
MSSTFVDERGEMVFNFQTPPFKIHQSFTTSNHKNVIRGMHFSPYKKFVTVVSGRILDVIVNPNGSVNTYELKTGDSILVDEHHGHGYFCFEDSIITYVLGGEYDPSKEKNCHWKDPTLNIKWPENSKYAIVSDKDKSNPLFKPIETLILGSSGFLGSQLLKYVPNSIGSSTRLENIEEELRFLKPKHVISAAGISGKPTIDWCESNKEETLHVNLTQQLHLIQICKNLGIHLTILGSAMVYDGNKYFTEEDEPNYDTLFYSYVRIQLENIIRKIYLNDVLYLRIIYPVAGDDNPKCFLNKLKSRRNNIHDTNVSITVVPSLFPQLQNLITQRVVGILNFTNDGCVSLGKLMDICNEKYTISNETSNRGECKMDVTKLKGYIDVENVLTSIGRINSR